MILHLDLDLDPELGFTSAGGGGEVSRKVARVCFVNCKFRG